MNIKAEEIRSVELVQKCEYLTETLKYFIDELDFKLEMIFPADNPAVAVIKGFNIRIRLDRNALATSKIRITTKENENTIFGIFEAPNGTIIEICSESQLNLPENVHKFVFSKLESSDTWITGRAGMEYRDLITGRQNGRFIASHIKIEKGGPVPDYTHFHNIRFQLIYCYKGWVKVAYEDQGDIITMKAGDCFLQPPLIRHQVLESSDGLEVIEVGCPAEHETFTDIEMTLPTGKDLPEREFNGQLFVYHDSSKAEWKDWRLSGFECRDTGINEATKGLVAVNVVRPKEQFQLSNISHNEEFLFFFVLNGILEFQIETQGDFKFSTGDSFVVPKNLRHQFTSCSDNLELLELRLSGDFSDISH